MIGGQRGEKRKKGKRKNKKNAFCWPLLALFSPDLAV